ncbi:MAG TPA: T9SS type A sorting domain-containing protein, partial [Bacteroidetes bacterium]|nr:T9SS type A sorting domain-containing protein [Bacteroidota bacterium]
SYDILDVQGPATLDGTLNVTLLGGNPTAGTDFAIVMATGGLGGTQFSTVNFPAPASDWSITYNTNDVVISYQTALPVELIDFKVFKEKTHILLEWRTASETNNRGFEIQSSVGSLQSTVRNWKTLGFVAGQGNSAGQHDYQFLDKNPQPGINYYRLRQMDFDGRFSFSKIISVEWDGADGNGFSVFPNPVSRGVLYLEMPFQNEKEWELTLINAIGQTVRQASFQNVETSVYEWKIPDLPTGVYWLQMQDGQRSWAQRVVVK